MVIAEMIATGDLEQLTRPGLELDLSPARQRSTGRCFGEGIGLGHVVLHEPRIVVTNLLNEDAEHELGRLAEALGSLSAVHRRHAGAPRRRRSRATASSRCSKPSAVLRRVRRLEEAIRNRSDGGSGGRACAERHAGAACCALTDPVSARADAAISTTSSNRLLRQLIGPAGRRMSGQLAAEGRHHRRPLRWALPSCSTMPASKLRGLVLEDGAAQTAHVTIVAKALGIATVGHVENVLTLVTDGDAIIVDGSSGMVHIRPPPDVEAAYAEKVRFRAQPAGGLSRAAARSRRATTRDGVRDRIC